MTLAEITAALAAGKRVFWRTDAYEVQRHPCGKLVIECGNGHCIGLTWADGVTLNGNESDFYTQTENDTCV